jgi:hypothetical protein
MGHPSRHDGNAPVTGHSAALRGMADVHRFWRADIAARSPVFAGHLSAGVWTDPPAGIRAEAYRRTIDLLSSLNRADVYYITPGIGDLLFDTATALPDATIRPDSLPSRDGWLWLADPLVTDHPPALQALQWSTIRRSDGGPDWTQDGLAITGYAPGSPPVFYQWAILEFGAAPAGGFDVNWPVFLLATFGQFVRQRILTSERRPVLNRGLSRRLATTFGHTPEVRVIQLRHADPAHTTPPANSRGVEWSCQWIVRGHWRMQPVKDGRREARWIMPYVKGPPDKPIRVRRRLFNVAR